MGIPLNLIHFLIGAPILAYIFIHGLFFTKDKTNVVTKYFAVACGIYAIAALGYVLPSLFTSDSGVLTITTIIADFFQFLSLAVVSLLATHLSLSRWPLLHRLANISIFLLTCVYTYVSIRENFGYPAHLEIRNGSTYLDYVATRTYSIWTGIAFSSLLFVGISFLAQVKEIMKASQRYRIAAFGSFLSSVGLLMIIVPIFNLDIASFVVTVSAAISFMLLVILLVLSHISAKRERTI